MPDELRAMMAPESTPAAAGARSVVFVHGFGSDSSVWLLAHVPDATLARIEATGHLPHVTAPALVVREILDATSLAE